MVLCNITMNGSQQRPVLIDNITLPELCLVVLVGPSGSGKSTFAHRHFGEFEVISSDYCRGLVGDNVNDQSVTTEAFDLLHEIVRRRLRLGRLTVVDATNVRPEDRKPLVQIAREQNVLPVAVIFDVPERVCQERNQQRPDRDFGPQVIRNHRSAMKRGLKGLKRQGFRQVVTFKSVEEIEAARVQRQRLWNNRKDEHGPFDIIGDVHGCFDELIELLGHLGYDVQRDAEREDGDGFRVMPPVGRKAVFLGDLIDRGPKSADVLRLMMSMCANGVATCVPGNHDVTLMRALRGKKVQLSHGLAETIEQFYEESDAFR